MEYRLVNPEDCPQIRYGRNGTPCYNELTRMGAECGLHCPSILVDETNHEVLWKLLHSGICPFDERHPDYLILYSLAASSEKVIYYPEP